MATDTEALPDLAQGWLADLEARQDEIRPQYELFLQLEDLKERLLGNPPAPARVPGTPRRANSGDGRAPQGRRKEQFLAVIRAHPEGIKIPEIVKEMPVDEGSGKPVKPNYLYRLRNQAAAANLIKQVDDVLFPADA